MRKNGNQTVVVLTALDVEYNAVRAHLTEIRRHVHHAGTQFEVGRLPGGGGEIVLAVTGQGNASAAVLAERAIAEFDPRALLFVGIAGALATDIELGDVVVGTKIYAYHGGLDEADGFYARPRAWEVSHELDQLARLVNRDRQAEGKVHFRAIAAGEVVLNSQTTPLADQLRRNYNDAAAIEMESAGTAQAAHFNRGLPTLTVRGISDRADGNKYLADSKGSQLVAARNAAGFAMDFVAELIGKPAGSQGLDWVVLDAPVDVQWRSDLARGADSGPAALEVHLVPADASRRLEVRRLERLPDELDSLGRTLGLFNGTEKLWSGQTGVGAAVHTTEYETSPAGIAVLRSGQMSGWTPLPRDSMGAVLDPADLVSRIRRLLEILAAIDLTPAPGIVPVIGIQPAIMVTEDSVQRMPRNRASGLGMRNEVRVLPDDSLPGEQFIRHPDEVAEELAARLMAEFRQRRY
ncbi:nucleoside phosphorylase [Kibdelosporangium banguiense]|uniref:Nucleoside phosphorylase n=1 Tax=Kibdelosporangium banguiense TaxID=1365924 RepID=A0ABS4TKI4_9PSEU|nr:5'-methylthioadenosine/S-adenosylhomocysteine nucleosidase [Kibdelosporangium banguiense]MBP2324934.1 nucleoside phosphorylase [Kibdelosporangium banguiense]